MHMEILLYKAIGQFLGEAYFRSPGLGRKASALSPDFYSLSSHSVFIILTVESYLNYFYCINLVLRTDAS